MVEQGQSDIVFFLVVGTMTMVLLAVFIILFVVIYQKKMMNQKQQLQIMEFEHQKNLLMATINTQEKERRRIAGDLHDEVGTMLSATKLALYQLDSSEDTLAREVSKDAKEIIDETITIVRRISKELLPASLEEFGLVIGLKLLCERIDNNPNTKISYNNIGLTQRLDSKIELSIYRVIQELINNSLKHANASEINIVSNITTDYLNVQFTDNGIGFDHEALRNATGDKGLGLRNMESRINLINGKIKFSSPTEGGINVSIDLDL